MGIFEKLLYFSIITVADPEKKVIKGIKNFRGIVAQWLKNLPSY